MRHIHEGVTYHPLQRPLIAKDAEGRICIHTPGYPVNAGYKINERMFEAAVQPYLHGDWADDGLCQLLMEPGTVVYSGAEHDGTPKLPNMTVVPNWPMHGRQGAPSRSWVMGCTMGHHHPPDPVGPRIQEIYEFLTTGLLVIDRENGAPEIWVARAGDKVAVPTACHMTLYNLGESDQPLITLDFANPERNPSDKAFITTCGPILLVYYDHAQVTFVLNRLYMNHAAHQAGVRLDSTPTRDERCITIRRTGRMDLGQFLYEQLTGNPTVIGQFARLGLQIMPASPQVTLMPVVGASDGRLSFTRPLAQATVPGSAVYSFFMPREADTGSRVNSDGTAFVRALATKAALVKKRTALQALNRPLVLLVQGAGEWVAKAFRPTCIALLQEGYRLSVFYADDTAWRGVRPVWTDALHPWEVYLDKAVPHDLALYHNVLARVDAVIIATPDVTHAALAMEGVRRRVPTILVEKPFASHHAHVEALIREMGLAHRQRAVVGLDHYLCYAAAVPALMPAIQRHLGGALARVTFYMTEPQPIERERERSLQYGLLLDMLPHMLALLTYFGAVQTVDEIQILAAGQYHPLISQDKDGQWYTAMGDWYNHETYARVQFTLADSAGNRVPCVGVIGKGLAAQVKYLEVTGVNGNAIRIDLGKEQPAAYPYDSVFFLAAPTAAPGTARPVGDPYDPARVLSILPEPQVRLDRALYKRLLVDLIKGTDDVLGNVLLLEEAYDIVKGLESIWDAVQQAKPHWREHELGQLQPVQPDSAC